MSGTIWRTAFSHSNAAAMTEGKKVIYDGVRLFTTEGLTRFNGDFDLAFAYLWKRAFRRAFRFDPGAPSGTS